MFLENERREVRPRRGAAIRARYRDRVSGKRGAERLEAQVRSLAREARVAGLTPERAIALLKFTVLGASTGVLPLLVTDDDRREYQLFETMIGWILDEFYGRPEAREA